MYIYLLEKVFANSFFQILKDSRINRTSIPLDPLWLTHTTEVKIYTYPVVIII